MFEMTVLVGLSHAKINKTVIYEPFNTRTHAKCIIGICRLIRIRHTKATKETEHFTRSFKNKINYKRSNDVFIHYQLFYRLQNAFEHLLIILLLTHFLLFHIFKYVLIYLTTYISSK